MLRKILVTDAVALATINAEDLGYELDKQRVQEKIREFQQDSFHHFLLVFENLDEEVVGYVHAEVYSTLYSETMFNVLGLAVARKARHQGIGTLLMMALEQEGRRREYAGIRLNSGEERLGAHRFYEGLGYQSTKNQKRLIKYL
ncbi:GNAT family N-acetyltransferase [Candidatus Enterococcus courvalinii]|uniref:GNAT family N-acetyltransferase n=1 Tax=Candidatus Enterococcus courvalinii TaxID=2815329 RepID=A0ABS3I1T8_9ENTE|nr:GNAT family N-acetyltransferase [Enterococcus sp. MSG2901]MBO0482694.1 GNAT family N-acetyltransferase [Enterococcus sp. MSG2901]